MPDRGGREQPPPYWHCVDEAARSRLGEVERRVGDVEDRADALGAKLENLHDTELRRKGRVDDIMGVGKVLALLASIGGAILAWLSYAHR